MQVSVKTTTGLEREMTIVIPAERLTSEVETRLAKTAKTARIDGFRKGKVPVRVIRQRFGEGIRQEVISDLVRETYGEALQKESINPAGSPRIEAISADKNEDFSYKAIFEVYPEIELADLSGLKVEQLSADVSDADIEDMLENLRNQSGSWQQVDRAAREGDQVTLDFSGSIAGERFEGGTAENQKVEIGSGRMIPGFEEGLAGLKADDKSVIKVTFPDDYQADELAGKAADFDIQVKTVAEKQLPELDDAFAERFGVDGGLDALRAEIRKSMASELENALANLAKSAVMNALAEANDIPLPSALVGEEVHRMKHEMADRFQGQGQKIDPHNLPDELFQEQAQRRVKLGLLVSEVLKTNEIKLDSEKVRSEISRQAASYDQPEEVEKYFYSNQQLLNSIQMKVLEDQVVSHILEVAKVTTRVSSYKDVIANQSQNA